MANGLLKCVNALINLVDSIVVKWGFDKVKELRNKMTKSAKFFCKVSVRWASPFPTLQVH